MKALRDVKEAASLLAVSPWTIRAYIRDGRLRPVRIGRLVRLEENELERFVAEAKHIQSVPLAEHSSSQEEVTCTTK